MSDEPMVLMEFAAVADRDDAAGIDDVQQVIHDRVILAAGERRRSGVTWTQLDAGSGSAQDWLRDNIGERSNGLRHFLAENPRGLLIVASVAISEPPP